MLSFNDGVFFALQANVHISSVRTLRYGPLAYFLGERTTPRLGQSSKIISVDGNLASGKGALAQKLAVELGNYLTVGILYLSLYCHALAVRVLLIATIQQLEPY